MVEGEPGLGIVENGLIAARDGRIVYAGPRAEAPAVRRTRVVDCEGRWITPGSGRLPHPYRLWRQSRARVRAAAGGRELRRDRAGRRRHRLDHAGDPGSERGRLVASALPRVDALIREGVTTLEIKSGYGLDLDSETEVAAGGAAAGRRPAALGVDDVPGCARPAAGGRRRQGHVHRRQSANADAAGGRGRRSGRCGRRLLRDDRLLARADRARVRGGARPSACR